MSLAPIPCKPPSLCKIETQTWRFTFMVKRKISPERRKARVMCTADSVKRSSQKPSNLRKG